MSGGEVRVNILAVAILVSIGLHVGGMFFAKPMVMTHGAPTELARTQRRPPMRVSRRAQATPPPTAIENVADVEAPKNAPEAAIAPPKPLEDLAEEARAALRPELPETTTRPPEPEDRVSFDAQPIDLDRTPDRPSVPMVEIDTPRLKGVLAIPEGASPASAQDHKRTEIAALPAVGLDDLSLFAPSEADRRVLLDNAPAPSALSSAETFVPVREVTERVDERLVAREKEAVRELFARTETTELTNAVKIALSATSETGWTYFRVAFRPVREMPTIAKDVVLILDASGSIGRDRIRSVREAAREILRSCMNSGDRFNLVAFRDKYDYASRTWMECDRRHFDFADSWLGNLAAHGRTDVFATIRSVLTLPRDPARPLIALVVTDGDANSGVSETAEIISRFTELNDGLVSVYMYGVKEASNRELIDVLTRGNRGESLVYDGWMKWKAASKVGVLAERFRDPVLSDIRVVFAAGSNADAYPRRMRNLYRGDEIEIVGRVPSSVRDVAFSVRGLNGRDPYESFFRLPLASATPDADIKARWEDERRLDSKLGRIK